MNADKTGATAPKGIKMKTYIQMQAEMANYLKTHELPGWLGSMDGGACTVAAARLAIDGILSDDEHPCISNVIRRFCITFQDRMPHSVRNGEWKNAAPLIIGTGQKFEKQRIDLILAWTWAQLKVIQPIADAKGFGPEWAQMCEKKNQAAANAAANAAAAADAADAANAANYAAATADAADAADAAAANYAAVTADYAADANYADVAVAAAAAAAAAEFWEAANPAALLKQLCELSN